MKNLRVSILPRAFLFAALALGALDGCKGTDTSDVAVAPNRADPADVITAPHREQDSGALKGWKQVTCADLSISLPPGLEVHDGTKAEARAGTAEIAKIDPELAKKSDASIASGNVKLMAIDGSHTRRRAFVIEEDPLTDADRAAIKAHEPKAIPVFDPAPTNDKTITLAHLGEAWRLEGPAILPDHPSVVVYVILHNDKAYSFQFFAGPNDISKWEDEIEMIMATAKYN